MNMTKRISALLPAALLACALTACGVKAPPVAQPTPSPVAAEEIRASAAPTAVPLDAPAAIPLDAHTAVAWANWSDDPQISELALNKDDLGRGTPHHLPVYKCGTAEELEQFKAAFSGILSFAEAWDEIPSFDDATAACDDVFFADHALLLVYVEANSCTFRFDVSSVSKEADALCIHICQTNHPEVFDTATAGWWMVTSIESDGLQNIQRYDAILE